MAPMLILMAATAAVSAYGAISSSRAQAASFDASKKAATYNAEASAQNATAAEQAASANELRQREANNYTMGLQRARVAESAGGFTGTNVGVLNQSATNLELSALNTRYAGKAQARGLMAQSNLDEYQANIADINEGTALTSGYIGAAANALGTTSNYYNQRALYGGQI